MFTLGGGAGMSRRDVAALVSLDGGIGTKTGAGVLEQSWRIGGASGAEVLALGKAFPTRGELCHHCGLRIPAFAELSNASQRRIRALIREKRPIMAIQELRTLTGCSLPWAKLWVQHAGRPRALRRRGLALGARDGEAAEAPKAEHAPEATSMPSPRSTAAMIMLNSPDT